MEKYGLVERKVYPEVPLKAEYSLTDEGAGLKDVYTSMASWGQKYTKLLGGTKEK